MIRKPRAPYYGRKKLGIILLHAHIKLQKNLASHFNPRRTWYKLNENGYHMNIFHKSLPRVTVDSTL